jgi:hypothetical protein
MIYSPSSETGVLATRAIIAANKRQAMMARPRERVKNFLKLGWDGFLAIIRAVMEAMREIIKIHPIGEP